MLQHTQHLQMQVFQCFIGVMFSVLFSVKRGGERVLFSSTVVYIYTSIIMYVYIVIGVLLCADFLKH